MWSVRLTKATLDNPVVYLRRCEDGTFYVGEARSLRRRYNEEQRKSIVHIRKACANDRARRRQEQQLIAQLLAQGYQLSNEKIQTHDLTPVLTSCDAPNEPVRKRKRWIDPDPLPDPDDPDSDPD